MSPSSASAQSTSLTKHRGNSSMMSSSASHRGDRERELSPSQHTAAAPNIWQMMNYAIPRGQCKHKPSLLAATCPCLRFMLNPLQAASTYTCDGCGHHASFHVLKNPEDADAAPMQQVVGVKRREIVDLSDEDEDGENNEEAVNGVGNGNGKRVKRLTNGSVSAGEMGERRVAGTRGRGPMGQGAVKRARAS